MCVCVCVCVQTIIYEVLLKNPRPKQENMN